MSGHSVPLSCARPLCGKGATFSTPYPPIIVFAYVVGVLLLCVWEVGPCLLLMLPLCLNFFSSGLSVVWCGCCVTGWPLGGGRRT